MLFGRFRTWLVMVAVVVILCGMLFGYDQGVIAGALAGMTASFNLSTVMQEVVTSLTVGLVAIAGAFAFLDKNPTTGGGASVVGIVTLIAMVVYIASFAFSLGPVVWTMISEIFPSQVRGKAVAAVSAAVNWGAAFVVSATFLSLIDAIGEVATFLLFALMCVIAFVWIKAKVPETKGKSLEQIQEVWAEHDENRGAKAPTLQVDLA
jgi:SP family galactose:H+ symporter-like MFS transporter